jgi:proline dehydrogenase
VPKPIVRRLAAPYIAGETVDDAVRVVRRLNAAGKLATVDVLGEEVESEREAQKLTAAYYRVLDRIEREGLEAGISVKLSALGLEIDEGLARANLESLLVDARARGSFGRIEMENSSTTDAALRLYRDLRAAGHENLGVVIQAYLHRSLDDLPGLANVRLCKGIYIEPPDVSFTDPDEIRASFLRLLDALLDAGSYVAIATHDDALLDGARRRIEERGLGREDYEFQMLLGVRPERGDALVREGHRLRVYVPFGTHWYRYSVRRLQENPRMAGYAAADTLRRLRGGRLLTGASQQ